MLLKNGASTNKIHEIDIAFRYKNYLIFNKLETDSTFHYKKC